MKRPNIAIVIAAATLMGVGAAQAQMPPTAPPKLAPSPSQTGAAGSAGVKARLEALGFKDVKDLRRRADGRWQGRATRNNRSVTVTTDSAGSAQ